MEKLLDQLVTPPLTLDAMQSESIGLHATSFKLPDTSISLEESHNSSTTNSSNSSWMSESSCGCHSPRSSAYPVTSFLIFHNRSILPPLLCSATRTEMQVYRTKALEKERKRRKQQKSNLLSRVEAILSSVDQTSQTDVTTSTNSHDSSSRSPDGGNTEEPSNTSSPCKGSPSDVKAKESSSDSNSLASHQESNPSEVGESIIASPEDAYRHSLQNLLQKSLTLEANSAPGRQASIPATGLRGAKTQQVSTSSSGGSEWADDTMATVIPNHPLQSRVDDNNGEAYWLSEENLESTAEKLVNTALEDATKDLMTQMSTSERLHQNEEANCDLFLVENADEENPLTSSSIDFPYYSPRINPSGRQSTSPCKATEHINKALHLIENNLIRSSSRSDVNHPHTGTVSENSTMFTVGSLGTVSSDTSSPDFFKEKCPPSMTTSVTPETESLLISYINALEAEEAQTTGVEGLPLTGKTSPETTAPPGSQLTPSAFNLVQSEAIQQVASHLSVVDEPNESDCDTTKDITLPSPVDHRVRRNSYSLDAPSPFLISSRDAHTVYPLEDESRPESVEAFSSDVKRKLEMPSDSEESSVSTARPCYQPSSFFSKDNATMSDYCKMLEEQHRKEMEKLQARHEAQLNKFKEELLHGKCQLSDSLMSSSVFEAVPAWQEDNYHPPMDRELHKKWCKFSALIKGHLTRKLLASRPVQTTMQTIRDTSRTILSMRSEDNSVITSMSSIQDATLMNRLFSQLKAALYDFHTVFFETPIQERMEMISRSRSMLAHAKATKVTGLSKHPRLSAATLKSLQRKKSERKSKENGQKVTSNVSRSKRPVMSGHSQPRQVTSKISCIWKVDPLKKFNRGTNKKAARSPPNAERKPKPWSPGGVKGTKNSKLSQPARKVLHRSMATNLTPGLR